MRRSIYFLVTTVNQRDRRRMQCVRVSKYVHPDSLSMVDQAYRVISVCVSSFAIFTARTVCGIVPWGNAWYSTVPY